MTREPELDNNQRSLIMTHFMGAILLAGKARVALLCRHNKQRLDAAGEQKRPAFGGADRGGKGRGGGVAALARPVLRSSGAAAAEGGCPASRCAPRLPGRPDPLP